MSGRFLAEPPANAITGVSVSVLSRPLGERFGRATHKCSARLRHGRSSHWSPRLPQAHATDRARRSARAAECAAPSPRVWRPSPFQRHHQASPSPGRVALGGTLLRARWAAPRRSKPQASPSRTGGEARARAVAASVGQRWRAPSWLLRGCRCESARRPTKDLHAELQ
jgi:hypothetical protein